jgi:hypothetical protein
MVRHALTWADLVLGHLYLGGGYERPLAGVAAWSLGTSARKHVAGD